VRSFDFGVHRAAGRFSSDDYHAPPREPSHVSTPIDRDTVEHVARLARLQLSGDEITRLQRELGEVLDYANRLKELDTENVEPMASIIDRPTLLAPDEPRDPLSSEALMRMAPATLDAYITVPKVLGE
jgi:aspartyl-tRNA(Asn)/glutamyl-tRNA(Gln) amidotransferase subunit C